MKKSNAIEKIAYAWHTYTMIGKTDDEGSYANGFISGMIEMLSMMENVPRYEIYKDVVDYAKSHGLQIK